MSTLPFIGDNEKIALSQCMSTIKQYEGVDSPPQDREWFINATIFDVAIRYVELRHSGHDHRGALAQLNRVFMTWYSSRGLQAGPFDVEVPNPGPGTRPPCTQSRLFGSRAVTDDTGSRLHVGLSRFYWLWAMKHDPDRVLREMDSDVSAGYTFARVFAQLGNPADPNDYWAERLVDPFGWSNYDELLARLLRECEQRGLYVSLAIIGKGGQLDRQSVRRDFMRRIGGILRDNHKPVLLAQVMNEPGILGRVTTTELMELESILRDSSAQMVLTSTGAYGDTEGHQPDRLRREMGQVGTPHFDRDTTKSERQDRPWRQPWDWGMLGGPMMDDEHIGPGASVATEDRPRVLRSHRTVCFVSGFFGSVYHADPGIRGFGDLASTPGYRECPASIRFLPGDLPNGQMVNANTNFPNRHWHLEDEYLRSANGNTRGIVRAYGTNLGGAQYTVPFGPVTDFELTARVNMSVDCYQQDVNDLLWTREVSAGERVRFSAQHPDYLLVSRVR